MDTKRLAGRPWNECQISDWHEIDDADPVGVVSTRNFLINLRTGMAARSVAIPSRVGRRPVVNGATAGRIAYGTGVPRSLT